MSPSLTHRTDPWSWISRTALLSVVLKKLKATSPWLMLATLSGLSSLVPVAAQNEGIPIRSVEVFASTSTALVFPEKAPYSVQVYRTDEMELAQKALLAPAGTGRTESETERLQTAYLREKGKDLLIKLAPVITRHYQAEQLARQYGITGHPAIVINGSKVVYDVTDIGRAVAIFQKLQGG